MPRVFLIFCLPLLAVVLAHNTCEDLNADVSKSAFHFRSRCYVLTANSPALTWPEAAESCTDLRKGGLAMWMSGRVFAWIATTPYTAKWTWAGLFDVDADPAAATIVVLPDIAVKFTQSPTMDDSVSYSAGNMSNGIAFKSPDDPLRNTQLYGSIYVASAARAGYAEESVTSAYSHVICQYEDAQKIYRKRRNFRLAAHTIAVRDTLAMSDCINNLAICSSVAHSSATSDCQAYMVGPTDLGARYETEWKVGDVDYDLFELV